MKYVPACSGRVALRLKHPAGTLCFFARSPTDTPTCRASTTSSVTWKGVRDRMDVCQRWRNIDSPNISALLFACNHTEYPSIAQVVDLSRLAPPGVTDQGRPLPMIKISDNVQQVTDRCSLQHSGEQVAFVPQLISLAVADRTRTSPTLLSSAPTTLGKSSLHRCHPSRRICCAWLRLFNMRRH